MSIELVPYPYNRNGDPMPDVTIDTYPNLLQPHLADMPQVVSNYMEPSFFASIVHRNEEVYDLIYAGRLQTEGQMNVTHFTKDGVLHAIEHIHENGSWSRAERPRDMTRHWTFDLATETVVSCEERTKGMGLTRRLTRNTEEPDNVRYTLEQWDPYPSPQFQRDSKKRITVHTPRPHVTHDTPSLVTIFDAQMRRLSETYTEYVDIGRKPYICRETETLYAPCDGTLLKHTRRAITYNSHGTVLRADVVVQDMEHDVAYTMHIRSNDDQAVQQHITYRYRSMQDYTDALLEPKTAHMHLQEKTFILQTVRPDGKIITDQRETTRYPDGKDGQRDVTYDVDMFTYTKRNALASWRICRNGQQISETHYLYHPTTHELYRKIYYDYVKHEVVYMERQSGVPHEVWNPVRTEEHNQFSPLQLDPMELEGKFSVS